MNRNFLAMCLQSFDFTRPDSVCLCWWWWWWWWWCQFEWLWVTDSKHFQRHGASRGLCAGWTIIISFAVCVSVVCVCLSVYLGRISSGTAIQIWLKFCVGTEVFPGQCVLLFGGDRARNPVRAAEMYFLRSTVLRSGSHYFIFVL